MKHATVEQLSTVLTSFVFDAPAPWIEPGPMRDALDQLARPTTERAAPPRSSTTDPVSPESVEDRTVRDREALREIAEDVLDVRDRIAVHDLLRDCGDWPTARRVLAELTAVANDSDLPYELSWEHRLDSDPGLTPSWVTDGWFGRRLAAVAELPDG